VNLGLRPSSLFGEEFLSAPIHSPPLWLPNRSFNWYQSRLWIFVIVTSLRSKNAFVPKLNHLRNRLDTTPAPPMFPPQTNNFQKPIKFKSVLENEFFRKKGEKPREEKPEPKGNPKPKPKPKPFHCEHCGRDGHVAEFCFRRKREERLARELANKDRYRPSRGVPEPRLLSRGEGMVHTIYPRESREFVPRGEPPHREGGRCVGFGRGEFAGHSFARGQ
jgi:hypothetical protein